MAISPKEQHEKHAKSILARRAGNKSNETKAPVKAPAQDNTVKPAQDNTVKPVQPYAGLGVKELREECEGRGIKFKKKDTIAQLIAKLS